MSEPTTSGTRPAGASGGDSRKAFLVLGGLTLLVASALGGYAWLHAGQETTDNAQVEADVVAVTSRIAGVIATVDVHDNQTVTKGTVLLTLDDADISARLAQARAERETATAQAAGARAQAQVVEATARGGLQGAEAQVAAAAAHLDVDVGRAAGIGHREDRAEAPGPGEPREEAAVALEAPVAPLGAVVAVVAVVEVVEVVEGRMSEEQVLLTVMLLPIKVWYSH